MLLTTMVPDLPHAHDSTAAVALLYEHYYAAVVGFAYRRVSNVMDAEDIGAQTFVQALQAFDHYEDRGAPVGAWLLRIAANLVTDHRRHTRVPLLGEAALPVEIADHGASSHDDRVERQERVAWLHDHLVMLSPTQRRAIHLRYWRDYSVEEAARDMGRTPGATKQLLHRAVTTLRDRIRTTDDTMHGPSSLP